MSKAKTAGEKAATTAETALENGAAALKTGLEKALKGYDAVLGYNKDTAEAVMKSATVAGIYPGSAGYVECRQETPGNTWPQLFRLAANADLGVPDVLASRSP